MTLSTFTWMGVVLIGLRRTSTSGTGSVFSGWAAALSPDAKQVIEQLAMTQKAKNETSPTRNARLMMFPATQAPSCFGLSRRCPSAVATHRTRQDLKVF